MFDTPGGNVVKFEKRCHVESHACQRPSYVEMTGNEPGKMNASIFHFCCIFDFFRMRGLKCGCVLFCPKVGHF